MQAAHRRYAYELPGGDVVNQIGMRQRAAGVGNATLTSPSAAGTAIAFIRASSIVSSASSSALASVQKNVDSARAPVADRLKLALHSFVSEAVAAVGMLHVQQAVPRPLSESEQLGLAIASFRQKFPEKLPINTEVLGLKESDPPVFAAILTILKSTTTGAALACMADIKDFRQAPTLEKAEAIISKYIVDPKGDDDLGSLVNDYTESKTQYVNIYRSTYLDVMKNYQEAKLALAYRESDAAKKLATIFQSVLVNLAADVHSLSENLKHELRAFERRQANTANGQGPSFA